MNISAMLSGVGGQGTVLASKLIALSAMQKGLFARTAETIGMAQRGGCVVSHVRIGEDIHSPMIPLGGADLILGFEPAEAVRCLPYLKEGGTVVVSAKEVKPVTAALGGNDYSAQEMLSFLQDHAGHAVIVDTAAICEKCGSAKVLNVALLGAAAATGALGLTLEEMEGALRKRLPEKFLPMNLEALRLGAKAVLGE
ncbi:indolepyruvate oxidoreductase subunit beta [Zongyangia hominis]|uniref:Indolepyruvate oxidoreductase subunit beta n=1 Tax=Zongyangia hominis TaxID=2763677 RepID=A0A926ICI3_9FIRM|nr:indolepyruvate oxidoreductase subunit beta [Zongyangia hominis]MBC8571155.1 indolepyruvate oxidoreductase subunit beta [Zongyangia hominis]